MDGPGFKILKKMGWDEERPLGIRGEGLSAPIEFSFRHDKDYRGLGFEKIQTEEKKVEGVKIKINTVGDRYGVGVSDYGPLFIPVGCLKHIANLCGMHGGQGFLKKMLPNLRFIGSIQKEENGRHEWRLFHVKEISGNLCNAALQFSWNGPFLQRYLTMAAVQMYTPQKTKADDLLIQQLEGWAKIEDDYDAISWTITDPGDEEYNFDKLDEAVQRHMTHSRAGPPTSRGYNDISDMYLTRLGLDSNGMPLETQDGYEYEWGWKHWDPSTIDWPETHLFDTYGGHFACFPSDFNLERRPTRLNGHSGGIEDNEGRIVINGVMKNKGMNYMKASTPYGDCYINLKFTRYVPEIGESIKMLCRFQDSTMKIPLKCIKVLTDIDEYGDARAPL